MDNYKLNERNIQNILSNKNGMVGRDLVRRGRNVKKAAKRFVGVDTKALQKSIYSEVKFGPTAKGVVLYAQVGSSVTRPGETRSYALDHHNGTRRHIIRAKPGKVLAFPSKGRMVFATQVNHPGTRPNLYLVKALPAAGI
jgi:hypothetical protein